MRTPQNCYLSFRNSIWQIYHVFHINIAANDAYFRSILFACLFWPAVIPIYRIAVTQTVRLFLLVIKILQSSLLQRTFYICII